jgi:purine-cytosine permease-like protein
MTHWDTYNLFERFIFLIGYFTIVYLLIKLAVWICDKWDRRHTEKRAMQQKAQHSEPIDGTYWVYDCKAEIKQQGKGLRRETRDVRRAKGI